MKNLIFTSAGHREFRDKDNNPFEGNPIDEWTKGLKDFDVVTYCYDDSEIGKDKSDLWVSRKGTKYQNFYHYATTWSSHYNQYDYIWVVDDDMFMSTEDINKMFQLMEDHNIDLGQPSFSPEGMHYIRILVNDPNYFLRYTTYVECSAMILSRKGLERVLHTFDDTITGFAWDTLVSNMINNGENSAVFDSVQAYHAPSLSSIDRVMARPLHKVEGENLLKKYNRMGEWGNRDITSAIDLNGKRVEFDIRMPATHQKNVYKPVVKGRVVVKPLGKKDKDSPMEWMAYRKLYTGSGATLIDEEIVKEYEERNEANRSN
jgi:hypothetical protein